MLKMLPLQLTDFSKPLGSAVGFSGMQINHIQKDWGKLDLYKSNKYGYYCVPVQSKKSLGMLSLNKHRFFSTTSNFLFTFILLTIFASPIAEIKTILLLLQTGETEAGECTAALTKWLYNIRHQNYTFYHLGCQSPCYWLLPRISPDTIGKQHLQKSGCLFCCLKPGTGDVWLPWSSNVCVLSLSTVFSLSEHHPKLEGRNNIVNLPSLTQPIVG